MKIPTCLAGFAGILILGLSFTSCATPPAPAPEKQANAAQAVEREKDPESGDWKMANEAGGD
jgi:hypothetical protein